MFVCVCLFVCLRVCARACVCVRARARVCVCLCVRAGVHTSVTEVKHCPLRIGMGNQNGRTLYRHPLPRHSLYRHRADPLFFIRGGRNFSSTHAVQQGLQNYGDQNLPHFSRVGSLRD